MIFCKDIIRKYKRAYWDIMLNTLAMGISLIVLEIFIYPFLAKELSSETYGQMQTIVSLEYLIGATLGQALSTTRLVQQARYNREGLEGDFSVLALIALPSAVLITLIVCQVYFDDLDIISKILIGLFSISICAENYLEVGFRIELNYKKVLICRFLSCIGYMIGFFIFTFCLYWEFVFLVSFLLQIVYCIKRSKLLQEHKGCTPLFKHTGITYLALNISMCLSKALTYIDKLILYPVLGGYAVSVYFTATLMGKLVLKILEPINNVILSYLAKKTKISNNLWRTALLLGLIFCVIAYFGCLLISRPVLLLFYPQWTDSAMTLIPITTLILCISALTSILYPFSLKILKMSYQCLINGTCLIVYVIGLLLLVERFDLIGSCFALLISYLIKLIIMLILCFKNVTDEK